MWAPETTSETSSSYGLLHFSSCRRRRSKTTDLILCLSWSPTTCAGFLFFVPPPVADRRDVPISNSPGREVHYQQCSAPRHFARSLVSRGPFQRCCALSCFSCRRNPSSSPCRLIHYGTRANLICGFLHCPFCCFSWFRVSSLPEGWVLPTDYQSASYCPVMAMGVTQCLSKLSALQLFVRPAVCCILTWVVREIREKMFARGSRQDAVLVACQPRAMEGVFLLFAGLV